MCDLIGPCGVPKALGMETGDIPASRITASSIWDTIGNHHGPQEGRLGNIGQRWVSHRDDALPWIQV